MRRQDHSHRRVRRARVHQKGSRLHRLGREQRAGEQRRGERENIGRNAID